MLVVDQARGEDIPQIERLAARELRESLPRSELNGSQEDRLLVARDVDHNHIVGFCLAKKEQPCECHIVSLAVEREHQGEGIGGALLRNAQEAMRRQGIYRMNLEVRFDDVAARRFYERHGYAPAGFASRVYRDGGDALRLSRPL